MYAFKSIAKVPPSDELTDIILSRTQRKTPTVVRKGWKVNRIRRFYIRKVQFTKQNLMDKFDLMLREFPRLEVGFYFSNVRLTT